MAPNAKGASGLGADFAAGAACGRAPMAGRRIGTRSAMRSVATGLLHTAHHASRDAPKCVAVDLPAQPPDEVFPLRAIQLWMLHVHIDHLEQLVRRRDPPRG